MNMGTPHPSRKGLTGFGYNSLYLFAKISFYLVGFINQTYALL